MTGPGDAVVTGPPQPYEECHVVGIRDTARAFGKDFPPAASTSYVLGLAEAATHRSVAATLPAGRTTVGVRSVVDHLAPIPVGAELVVRPRLVQRGTHQLRFEVEICQAAELVARIEHHRAIVDIGRIQARLDRRGARGMTGQKE
jgi:predicted thioesterase